MRQRLVSAVVAAILTALCLVIGVAVAGPNLGYPPNTGNVAGPYATPATLAASSAAGRAAGAQAFVSSTGSYWSYSLTCPESCDGTISCVYAANGDGGLGCWSDTGTKSPKKALRIVIAGDSHTQQVLAASASGPAYVGVFGLVPPRSYQWSGSARNAFFRTDSQYGASTGSTDPNLGNNANTGSYATWIPGLLWARYPARLASIDIANVGIGGAATFSWPAGQASEVFSAVSNAIEGDTCTVAGVTYTFHTALVGITDVPNAVLIGASGTATINNLSYAINGETGTGPGTGAGTNYGTGTVPNPSGFVAQPGAYGTLGQVFALTAGTAGNALTMNCSTTTRISATNSAHNPVSSYNFYQGTTLGTSGGLYYVAKTFLAGGAGFGTPDIFVWTVGTNDGVRVGFRGRGTQDSLAQLFGLLATDYPSAKILIWLAPATTVSYVNTALTSTVNPAITAAAAAANAITPGQVTVVDCSALSSAGTLSTGVETLNASDGYHLTPYGYQLLASKMSDAIGTALGWP